MRKRVITREKQIWPSTGMEGKGRTWMNNTSDVRFSDPASEMLF